MDLIWIDGVVRIREGVQAAIVGDNAAGKTRLVELLTGARREAGAIVHCDFSSTGRKYLSDNVRYITFRDSYGASDANYYLQLRWNQMDIDPETPTLRETLEKLLGRLGEQARPRMDHLLGMFGLSGLLDKYIISLSSGELRKFQLTKALMASPKLLILDNPFIGLDFGTRAQLSDLLRTLAQEDGLTVILILSRSGEIPSFVDVVIPVEGMQVLPEMGREEYLARHPVPSRTPVNYTSEEGTGEEILRFNKVSIRYDERTILRDLDWCVRKGEHWALTGENGCGKSTLLSLVCADNPQAYACDIELFGRRRGTGESIWEIKKHIGYVSPEMHRSYTRDLPVIDIVASGLFDTVGLYRKPSDAQRDSCRQWMSRFGILDLADRSFLTLSSGEQRMCLLARAFVKNPDLLILDEPMHGLDESHRDLVRSVIDDYCADPSVTLVMVTHYLEELPSCIDRTLTLHRH